MEIGIVTDEELLKQMFKTRNFIRSTLGMFVVTHSEDFEKAGLDDSHIASVLIEISCEICEICDVSKEDFMRMAEGQFDITSKRVAQEQAESATKQ